MADIAAAAAGVDTGLVAGFADASAGLSGRLKIVMRLAPGVDRGFRSSWVAATAYGLQIALRARP